MSQHGQVSDEQLMLAAAAGDLDAFEALLTRYEKRIINFAWRILGEMELARDVYQQTFLKIFEKRDQYRAEARFSTYAYAIAHRLCLNELRRAERRRTSSYDQTLAGGDDDGRSGIDHWHADDGPGPVEPLEEQERDQLLHAALSELPHIYREVVVLRIFDGLPFRDIAKVIGVNESTIKSRLRYALRQLDRALRRALGPP
jgi:RNA polymerase sigma-70 factor, ECF subfamily